MGWVSLDVYFVDAVMNSFLYSRICIRRTDVRLTAPRELNESREIDSPSHRNVLFPSGIADRGVRYPDCSTD